MSQRIRLPAPVREAIATGAGIADAVATIFREVKRVFEPKKERQPTRKKLAYAGPKGRYEDAEDAEYRPVHPPRALPAPTPAKRRRRSTENY